MTDTEAMKRCLRLAEKSRREGNHPFGSVITGAGGELIAEGRNREITERDPTWHAETHAIKEALRSLKARSLEGYTIYTNGEPCLMCSMIIRRMGLSRVVYGASSSSPARVNPHPLLDVDPYDTPLPRVESGLLEEESLRIQGRL